jgi:hypothetical protein
MPCRDNRTLSVIVCTLVPIFVALGSGTAVAALGEVIATFGKWDVRRSVDMMTDEVTCIATHHDGNNIQLYDDVLYISVRGSPRGFKYRLDNKSPSDMQLVSDTERQIGAISLRGSQFRQVLQSSRLRVQIVTYSAMKKFDLELAGIKSAHARIVSGCKT